MPFLVSYPSPAGGAHDIARCIPRVPLRSTPSYIPPPLRGLILFTVDACAGFSNTVFTTIQVESRVKRDAVGVY